MNPSFHSVLYDVIIIGASFAGLTLAHHLPRELKILILDRKRSLDAAVESTGLITEQTQALLAAFTDVDAFIPNAITTIGVVSPDYDQYFFSHTENPWIYSTDTPKLVAHLAETLPENVRLEISAVVGGYTIDPTQNFPVQVEYTKSGAKEIVSGRFLVGADGAHSLVAKLNPHLSCNTKFLGAMEKAFYGEILLGEHPENTVYHFWFGEFSLGYGGWLSPTTINGRPAFRIGLAKLKKDLHDLRKLEVFITLLEEKRIIRREESEAVVKFGSLIPIGGVLKKIWSDNTLLIGDAAGFCGAFAADGIKGAIVSAQAAAELIPAYLAGNRNALKGFYERVEKKHPGLLRYYRKQLFYRFVWNRMTSNRTFQALYELISHQKDLFLRQFCDSREGRTSLISMILRPKNFWPLLKYGRLLTLDIFQAPFKNLKNR